MVGGTTMRVGVFERVRRQQGEILDAGTPRARRPLPNAASNPVVSPTPRGRQPIEELVPAPWSGGFTIRPEKLLRLHYTMQRVRPSVPEVVTAAVRAGRLLPRNSNGSTVRNSDDP